MHKSPAPLSHANNMVSLPYAHVDSSLPALASQAERFVRLAISGLLGLLYHVTTLAGHLHPSLYLSDHMMGWDHFTKDVVAKSHYGLSLKFWAPLISLLTWVGLHKRPLMAGAEGLNSLGRVLRLKECEHVINYMQSGV